MQVNGEERDTEALTDMLRGPRDPSLYSATALANLRQFMNPELIINWVDSLDFILNRKIIWEWSYRDSPTPGISLTNGMLCC